jgi:beta-glucosidase-like glycosyl hydrolase
MTTHIIFSAIDEAFPATLSEKVLQGLLRKTLGYEGLIITDGMGMAAISSHYGTPDVSSVLAIKAGVDILLYTGLADPKTAHSAIIKAVNNNELTVERINESVRRILLTTILKLLLPCTENFSSICRMSWQRLRLPVCTRQSVSSSHHSVPRSMLLTVQC